MAFSEQQLAALNTVFEGLPQPVKDMFNAASTKDTTEAIAGIISKRRRESMSVAVSQIVSGGSVSDWQALETAAQVADSATISEALAEFSAAREDQDAPAMFAHAVTVALAAKKHFST